MRKIAAVVILAGLAACRQVEAPQDNAAAPVNAPAPAQAAALSLTRLDCGKIRIKNFDTFFSDKPGLYSSEPRDVAASCYLIRHGDQIMLWDTGVSADLKGTSFDAGQIVLSLDRTLEEQLAELNVKPAEIDIVGISHMHADHTGQAAKFPQAKLLIGRKDYDQSAGTEDPFTPWREAKGGDLQFIVSGEADVFGDGSVMALHLPGHTPDHLALLVNLKSGPVLLTGDLYHSTEARQKRGIPPFNTSREQTLASMDAFEAKAKATGAKVVIQHEPADIAKLPAFPAAAE
jgi:N-acyl homoserine lactone hydrolase